jgi:pentatricopeptide repeat protein
VAEAIKLLREMQQQQLVADIITYNRVINACQKGAQWQLTLVLLAELKAAGLQPNVVTYNCVIDALHAATEHDTAEDLYVDMLERGLIQTHWSKTRDGMLDLREFSVGTAAAAVRVVLRDLSEKVLLSGKTSSTTDAYVLDVNSDLHIITGHAVHREDRDGCALQPVIISMLKQQGIDCYVNPDNKGRLIVKSSELMRYVDQLSSK